ncbi:alpha/beta hydrolase [Streptomyces sp. NPDC026672]|uniref:alpha/beta fold hydrolase n=1 Tax=unclassified Streptomyces TaxID=2593676 RepID=UPI0033CBBF62
MAVVHVGGIALEYDTLGPVSGEPLLIVQGLGDQMVKWDDGFHQALVHRGFRVIRFDNRDAGLSTHLDEEPVPDWTTALAEAAQGLAPDVPYGLEDMAVDALAVLDALGVTRAHLVGVSMGGMIAQLLAADHPARVLSLTSIMSSTGNPAIPLARPEALAVLIAPTPDPSDEDAYLAHALHVAKTLGSPGYPDDEAGLRARLLKAARRAFAPAGCGRQLAAIATGGDRRDKLKGITAPTLVIHGTDDPLVPIEAGQDTAECISGAELLAIPGMGHNLPAALYEDVADAITTLARES